MWTDIEPGAQSNQAYPVATRLNTHLRHGHFLREDDGAIEFWRLFDCLRNEFKHSQCWSGEMWKDKMAGGGGNKKRFQYCDWLVRTRKSSSPSSSRSFWTQSHWSFLYRTMCKFRTISSCTIITLDVQSIYTPSWIQDWYREDKI